MNMPAWLVNLWTVYGDMITPVLVTLITALLTSLALKIKSDAKANAVKSELQLEALKDIAKKEDNKPQLEEQAKRIEGLTKAVSDLGEMINLAFQNSTLDPEIKSNLTALMNKLKYGSEEDLTKLHEEEKTELLRQIEILEAKLKEQTHVEIKEIVEETTTRTRR